jgi:hypothetical protein
MSAQHVLTFQRHKEDIMAANGVLEMLARADLDALVEDLRGRYQAGALERMSARDPEWRAAIERAEEQVGDLYEALRTADATFARWRVAVGELRRLWGRLDEAGREPLDRVA